MRLFLPLGIILEKHQQHVRPCNQALVYQSTLREIVANMVLMVCHAHQSSKLMAAAKCAVFWGNLSQKGVAYFDKLFLRDIKAIFSLIEKKLSCGIHLKLRSQMQKIT